eukprot:6194261-Pleurochrysis_carterae.AAC.1
MSCGGTCGGGRAPRLTRPELKSHRSLRDSSSSGKFSLSVSPPPPLGTLRTPLCSSHEAARGPPPCPAFATAGWE